MATESKKRLSAASIYENMFGVRHRRPGRPAEGDGEPMFPAGDNDPLLVRIAQRRAFAVVHEEQRDRLSGVYATELKVLRRRGLAEVAEDAGVVLEDG